MKLDNRGWGTMEMALLCLGLFIAFLVSIYFISSLYGSLSNTVSKKEYSEMQIRLEEAGKAYIKNNNIEIDGELQIGADTLISLNYMEVLKDNDGNICNGYVKIKRVDLVDYYNGYISCPNFKTNNY